MKLLDHFCGDNLSLLYILHRYGKISMFSNKCMDETKNTSSLFVDLLTGVSRVSSLLMTSPVTCSLAGSLRDEDERWELNLQRSESSDRARETFRGFLKVTSTMMGSVETQVLQIRD